MSKRGVSFKFFTDGEGTDRRQAVGFTSLNITDNVIKANQRQLLAAVKSGDILMIPAGLTADERAEYQPLPYGAEVPDDGGKYYTAIEVSMVLEEYIEGGNPNAGAGLRVGGKVLNASAGNPIS